MSRKEDGLAGDLLGSVVVFVISFGIVGFFALILWIYPGEYVGGGVWTVIAIALGITVLVWVGTGLSEKKEERRAQAWEQEREAKARQDHVKAVADALRPKSTEPTGDGTLASELAMEPKLLQQARAWVAVGADPHDLRAYEPDPAYEGLLREVVSLISEWHHWNEKYTAPDGTLRLRRTKDTGYPTTGSQECVEATGVSPDSGGKYPWWVLFKDGVLFTREEPPTREQWLKWLRDGTPSDMSRR